MHEFRNSGEGYSGQGYLGNEADVDWHCWIIVMKDNEGDRRLLGEHPKYQPNR